MPFIDVDRKGILGELVAQAHYVSKGYEVFTPVGFRSRCDLIAMNKEDGTVKKVQVKTVQENTVKGITYLQCRVVPGKKPYKAYEVDEFLFVYKGKVLEIRSYEDVSGRWTANFGRKDNEVH